MPNILFPAFGYLYYWLLKEDHYSLQGPFLANLYEDLRNYIEYRKKDDLEIEGFRKKLLQNHTLIPVDDFGAGSKKVPQREREISAITRYSTSGRKFAQLYQFFASKTPAKVLIELGTCLGITTRYLSQVTLGKLATFEGSHSIQEVAKAGFKKKNTEFVLGKIQDTLPAFLEKNPIVDFALVDATHTFEATMYYFEMLLPHLHSKSILVIADIYWSREMYLAWKTIIARPEVRLSLDFYECGVVFFDFPGEKTHRILDY
ncbi:class I SAM-dependent methyltransferase [Algoriphagus kandeliae]|uniref:Class I SAM-dependent methyltransferase n=1 Tax=Algoriphagus kandeliae TaxID=2562278 RepID=A0A4Y9QPU2_9BACT|nr:class I SAM-dependent methyltransferase [Algoriphagus kandeliae]TFV94629.1 class I SAM-dependent methyltransferase [Algoriphagus kandeliae]